MNEVTGYLKSMYDVTWNSHYRRNRFSFSNCFNCYDPLSSFVTINATSTLSFLTGHL